MGSTFGVDGVISGLKTQDIITQLMAIEKRPIQLMQTQVDTENARLSAINSIKAAVTAFQSSVIALTRPSTVNAKMATTDTPSTSPAVLSATANADAINGSFHVTVNQIATATNVLSTGPIGNVINRTATLGTAGFRFAAVVTSGTNPATFSLNGKTISVDANTTLDDGTANSLLNKINAAGAGVTATMVADASGRANNAVQLVSDPGQAIQLGSLADTSNILRLLNLSDAVIQGNTAANLTGQGVAAGAINSSITINGVTTNINQSNAGFTDVQNAAFIANAINTTTGSTVNAVDNGDGTLSLQQKTKGASPSIVISGAGAETGFVAGTTKNGTDKIVSSAGLGTTDIGQVLASARLVTPIAGLDASGNGKFTINGVDIAYKSTDTVATVINRINASNAGATAFYDPVQDRVRLTASQTGARTITLADQTGNFLAATGLLGASQTLGNNAVFSIDSVNNGQALTSSTNTVSGYVPGVTLSLKSASATPVTVTVGQDTSSTETAIKSFVDKFNAVLDAIDNQTTYDTSTKQASLLTGDSGVLQLQRSLLSMVGDSVTGGQGAYRSLASIGISTGSIGTAVSTSYRLHLDTTKFEAAMSDNPQAVTNLIAGFSSTLGSVSGTAGNLASVSGTPYLQHDNGTYNLQMLDTSGNVKVTFVTTDGRTTYTQTGQLTAGQTNSSLIPGVTLTAGNSFTVGTTSFSVGVDTKGSAVRLNDYLNGLLGSDGFFQARQDSSTSITQAITQRISDMNERLADKQTQLQAKFTALETTMAKLQTQQAALSSAITQLYANSSSGQ